MMEGGSRVNFRMTISTKVAERTSLSWAASLSPITMSQLSAVIAAGGEEPVLEGLPC